MTSGTDGRVLSIVVCGASLATRVTTLIELAIDRGWIVQVVATPPSLAFIDQPAIEDMTGTPVRSEYGKPGAPRSRVPDAVIVAPATYNTINKWAQGICDTYALGVLAEQTGLGVPIVVLPFLNSALASRLAFQRSIETLRAEGVVILHGRDGILPHEPHTGGSLIDSFPWHLALNEADNMTDARGQSCRRPH